MSKRVQKELGLVLLSLLTVVSLLVIQIPTVFSLPATNTTVSLWAQRLNLTDTTSTVVPYSEYVEVKLEANAALDDTLWANVDVHGPGATLLGFNVTSTQYISPGQIVSPPVYRQNTYTGSDSKNLFFGIGVTNAIVAQTNATASPASQSLMLRGASFSVSSTTPYVQLTQMQNREHRWTAATNLGIVDVYAHAVAQSPSHTLSYDWSGSDAALVSASSGTTGSVFRFNPSGLVNGVHLVKVVVSSDNGMGGVYTNTQSRLLKIVSSFPTLGVSDSDADGLSDNHLVEGYSDDDQNGIANYLDHSGFVNSYLGSTNRLFTEPSHKLRLGDVAFVAGNNTPLITVQNFTDFGNGLGGAATADTRSNSGGLYDFVIGKIVNAGSSQYVVIPLAGTIPSNATLRVYASGSWQDFSEDANNVIRSANSVSCPSSVGSYTAGLTAGNNCLYLTVQDGGSNDRDGLANGEISLTAGLVLPAGTAPAAPTLVSPVDGASGVDPTTVTFEWEPATDTDGDTLSYSLHLCQNGSLCSVTNVAYNFSFPTFAAMGFGSGIALLGLIGISRRQRLWSKLTIGIATVTLILVACGGGGGGGAPAGPQNLSQVENNLSPAAYYTWKVVVDDGNGNTTDSATWSFTTQ